jgi:hypothetical protein
MKKITIAATLAIAAAAAAGCGGGEDATGAEVASASPAPYEITLGEWVAELEPEKVAVLKAYVADTPSCNAEFDDRRFLLTIAAVSTDYDASTPLPDVVRKYC